MDADDRATPAAADPEVGGDAACWLAKVCPDCGAMLDEPDRPCWRCGREPGDA